MITNNLLKNVIKIYYLIEIIDVHNYMNADFCNDNFQ